VTNNHIVDHVLVVGTCLISRAPSTVGKFQSTLLNEHLDIFPSLFVLAVIPHLKELHLDIGKLPSWIFQELVNSRVEDQMDSRVLSILVCS